jgi:surface polysaccharide O-acyltransferase-like enzyme
MEDVMGNNRNLSFEMLRVIAAFMVLSIHATIYYWKDCPVDNIEYLAYNIVNCLGRCSIPIFLMISGYFMLRREPKSIGHILKKAGRLIFVYVIWSALYAIIEFRSGEITIYNWLYYFVNEKFHLWYLPVMACIYIMFPLLYAITHFENGKYVKYAVILFFVFGICRCTLIAIFQNESLITAILNKSSVELCGYVGYFILGYYLGTIDSGRIKVKNLAVLFAVSFILPLVITQILAVVYKTQMNIFNSSYSIFNCMQGVALFLIFKKSSYDWNKHERFGKIIVSLSKASLGIYLIHPFILERLDFSFGINTKMCNAFISLPIVSVLAFVVSYVVITVVKKIPALKYIC